jgi:hypothetical protein
MLHLPVQWYDVAGNRQSLRNWEENMKLRNLLSSAETVFTVCVTRMYVHSAIRLSENNMVNGDTVP